MLPRRRSEYDLRFPKREVFGRMKTEKTPTMIQHMIESLQVPVKELNAWELNFLSSVSTQFHMTGNLSDAQFEKLEEIYAEKTA
jgi:hypothetical protein